ncbi:Alpha/Beta hydrolase protein [Dendryphion nanum]|uniref:Alpha/Beta hydrolase protein n=1 Tax=Dendryphion nanum TaxID=256645 RepID=A0A9P9D4D3_9PLEO|nr:Alpha/Beta hydrolase protein [Dendryphion nanum]
MAPSFSRYPLKAIATFVFILSAPSYLLFLTLLNLPRGRRPIRTWSLKTTIGHASLRLFYRFATKIQLQPSYANSKKLGERYVLVQPGSPGLYKGVLEHTTITPKPMPAVWFPKPPTACENKTVVIHFQGGAFVTATDPQKTGLLPARIFEEKLGATTFYAQYRLSRNEGTRFPAALQDVVTFYQYVLAQGVDPNNIILSGDSAGGNLVLAFLRYLEDHKELSILPKPRGAMTWSPWVDITDEALTRCKTNPQFRTDFLPLSLIQWGLDSYKPTERTDESARYLSPFTYPFHSDTPIFINAGTAELLVSEISNFSEKMTEISGNQIHYHETKDAPHDIILAGGYTGFVEQAEEAAKVAHHFFKINALKSL